MKTHSHGRPANAATFLARLLLALVALLLCARAATAAAPVLVVTSAAAPAPNYGAYYAEILRTEGLNAFDLADVATVTPTVLAGYDLVLLARMPLTSAQANLFSTWVNGGGNLIAMAPDAQLAALLGLTRSGTATLADGYLLVDTQATAGSGVVAGGIANQTLQFHGSADLYTLNGAKALATLYSNATTATAALNPAVTWRSVGSGQAAAFTYDLAASVVYTRQGNPAWAAQERDGFTPIRSDDKFYGNAAGDLRPDWVNLAKVAIPQADEQQRLLANLIVQMNLARKPLPRFWYFPFGKRAVVVMTGDDHGNNGTTGRFEQFIAASPAGCIVANWECVRGTSYLYPNTPLSDPQAAAYAAQGFEIGLHVNTQCSDYTADTASPTSLPQFYASQIGAFKSSFPSLPAPATQRHHCIVWSDWSTGAKVQLANGMRLDVTYYFWPPNWVGNVPGVFTGSAMPMRFADANGGVIDVYGAATQMTDESGQGYPFTVDTLLDRALGPEGYFGAYTVNAHTDVAKSSEADAVVASALARGVPVVSARQLLTWLDGRNGSTVTDLSWNGSALNFALTPASGATGLQAMLPLRSAGGVLQSIALGSAAVPYTVAAVKGIDYAAFTVPGGGKQGYVASYGADTTPPAVLSTVPADGAAGVAVTTPVKVAFSEAIDSATLGAGTLQLRDAAANPVAASVSYDAATFTASLKPAATLSAASSYAIVVKGGAADPRVKDVAGNALATELVSAFATDAGFACPCSLWDASATPAMPVVNDPGAVELGTKFLSDADGVITGIRFYKGSNVAGTYTVNLWSASGQALATASAALAASATGWQQVSFASPVAIAANTVYVASYHAPAGQYAANNNFFAGVGVDKAPLHALADGASGGNGVYAYSPASTFPTSTYLATNYWVDVVFTTGSGGGTDTAPPSVTGTSPANGATGVGTGAAVTANFSEAMDPASIGTGTFQLRNVATGVGVAASVAYDAANFAATLTPASPLAASTVHEALVAGGAAGVKDVAGNPLAANLAWTFTTGTAGGACAAPANPIVAENCLAGSSGWDIAGAGDSTIQGFATQIGVKPGDTIAFKVRTDASAYRFDIYRLGYYGGQGARKVATVQPSAALPQSQPACLAEASTGLIDCGNWAVSGAWSVPANAVSGIYLARLVRTDTGGASHIVFVVRDDAGNSDLLFQTSDTTWQAYNDYGGNSLYVGNPAGRAYKVSYNRPFATRAVDGGQDWLFNTEYPMLRWLEANGYNVSYTTGVDADRAAALLRNHKVFLSVGHDEYWSAGQRANVEAARDAGVHLAFFSGNEVFWKTRWENSIDGSNTPYRTLVSYKETHANAQIDPLDAAPTWTWTGTWRDPRFSPPADGGRPENALTGTLFMINDGATTVITVPAADGKMRFWRNTGIASLAAGASATLPNGTLGYEWDIDADNGFRPPGLFRLSTTTVDNAPILLDHGSTYGSGPATHSLTLYRHGSGALVFGAGTVQWPWGLDANHDRGGTPTDIRMQQATVNLLADMGVQPATLQSGLVAAAASTDASAPTSAITSPAAGATLAAGGTVTISGTAVDNGGVVGGVEVSTDNGATWRPAGGRGNWTYAWTPTAAGTTVIKSRAVDDSGNLESPGAGVSVSIGQQSCPCSIWSEAATPAVAADPDTGAVELGLKFRADVAGTISAIRFYKGSTISGTYVVNLWDAGGQRLATASVALGTETGWQQVQLPAPLPSIAANTTYVVSYFAPQGRYAADGSYFANAGYDNPPLHALSDAAAGGNGVYQYGAASAFPASAFEATNYWVDVVFTPSGSQSDTTPPAAPAGVQASATANGIALSWTANTEPDLAGYNVYRSAGSSGPFTNRLNAALLTAAAYLDTAAPAGTSFYVLKAADQAGNESAQSAVVSAAMAAANLIQNPGFELATNGVPDNWTSNARVRRSNAVVHGGSFSMRHLATNNASYSINQVVTGLDAGRTYAFSGWVNIPATGDAFTFALQIRWRNASNSTIRTDTVRSFSAATGGWVNPTASLTAPAGTTNAQVLMAVSSLNATVYVDDFELRGS